MTIALKFAPLIIDDPDAALGFYRDALGLELRNDVALGGHRWLTLGIPGSATPELVLHETHAGHSQADGDALQELVVKGAMPPISFTTDDLDGLFSTLVAAGAEVVQEPADMPWGPREGAVRDPSGNQVRLSAA